MSSPLAEAQSELDSLRRWLLDAAYPLWWRQGFDHARGGFHERLGADALPRDEPRRARVQPRQIYSFAVAERLGWAGPARKAVEGGLDWYLRHYRRPDGLFRAKVGPDGAVLDDGVVLYDQAFALFGLAIAAGFLDAGPRLAPLAAALLAELRTTRRHELAGFHETTPPTAPLLSNPHMHLFEACLEWEASGGLPEATALADEIAALALTRLIDPASGGVREYFALDWSPAAGEASRILEPGHQFEWAWLLLRWGRSRDKPEAIRAALRLLTLGETHGIDHRHGVAINALLDDFSVHDGKARLWPQTERLKAACLAAEITGEADYWLMAARAARGLRRYFSADPAGLWCDYLDADGRYAAEPAPASSFYHIVCAIVEFDRVIAAVSA